LTWTPPQHCTKGIGIWPWASNDQDAEPTCHGLLWRRATLETLAAVSIMREHLPDLKSGWSTSST